MIKCMTEAERAKARDEQDRRDENADAFYDLVASEPDEMYWEIHKLLSEDEADVVSTNIDEERRQYESMYIQDDDDDRRDC